jgi:hypothetical protein
MRTLFHLCTAVTPLVAISNRCFDNTSIRRNHVMAVCEITLLKEVPLIPCAGVVPTWQQPPCRFEPRGKSPLADIYEHSERILGSSGTYGVLELVRANARPR